MSIKIMHFADTHFGIEKYGRIDPDTGMNSRLQDFRKSLDWAITTALDNDIDIALFSGDAYKARDPNQTHQREFASCIRMLTESNIPVVMITGNHDLPNTKARANAIEIFRILGVSNIHIISKPEVIAISTKSGLLQVAGLPYLLRSNVLQKDACKNKTITEITDMMVEKYSNYIDYLAHKLNPEIPSVFMGHFWVKNAKVSGNNSYLNASEPEVLLSSIVAHPFDYVAMGHIHKYQNLNQNGSPPVVYSGSIDRIDFGEYEEDKGFVIADVDKGACNYKFVPIPVRRFVNIEIDADCEDPTKEIVDEIGKYNIDDAVVKISYKISQERMPLICEQDIRSALSSAFMIVSINREVTVDKTLVRSNLLNESLDPVQALEMYFNTKENLRGQEEELMEYAKPLIDEQLAEEAML